MKTVLGKIFLLIFIFWIISISFITVGQQLNDPLLKALQEYHSKINENISSDMKQILYQEWFDKLTILTTQNTSSIYYRDALEALCELANVLNKQSVSEEISIKILGISKTDIERIFWYDQLGTLNFNQYNQKKDVLFANKSLQYYQNAIDLSKKDNIKIQDNVIVMYNMAEIYKNVFNNSEKAADILGDARLLYDSLDDQAKNFLDTLYYDTENLVSNEMINALSAGDITRAKRLLDVIDNQEKLRWPTSYYFKKLVDIQFPKKGIEYIESVKNWLDIHTDDSWSPFLKFYLARECMEQNDFKSAIEIYMKLLDNDYKSFQKEDIPAIQAKRGGYRAEILYNLAMSYNRIGVLEQALKYFNEFIEVYTNDPRIEGASSLCQSITNLLNRTYSESLLSNEKESPSVLEKHLNMKRESTNDINIKEYGINTDMHQKIVKQSNNSQHKTIIGNLFGNALIIVSIISFTSFIILVFLKRYCIRKKHYDK